MTFLRVNRSDTANIIRVRCVYNYYKIEKWTEPVGVIIRPRL